MVIVTVLASLLLLVPAIATGQGRDAETERRRIEALIYAGQRTEAAVEAARLLALSKPDPGLARVGEYVRCHLLFLNYRRARTDARLEPEAGRQAERAFTGFLAAAAGSTTDVKARFLLGLFLQDRARIRQERNNVLWAAEIAADLRRSSAAFTAVIGRVAPATNDTEAAALRRWSRVQVTVNFLLLARVYSPSDRRRAPTLSMALARLPRLAEEFPGLPEGNLAYFHYGLALGLYGATDRARDVFVDLWKSLRWDDGSAPFLQETLWHICRLDREAGRRPQVIAAALLLRRRFESIARPPSRFAARIVAAAAQSRLEIEGPPAAARGLEAALDWLDSRQGPATRELCAAAAAVATAEGSHLNPVHHPRVMLLAARCRLVEKRAHDARALAGAVGACRALPASLRARALRTASRSWEALEFPREALCAHAEALRLQAPEDEGARVAALRRTASLRNAIYRLTRTRTDFDRYAAARARVPDSPGELEYRTGARAYRNGHLESASTWLGRVPEASRFHSLALALSAHIDYLVAPQGPAGRARLEAILRRLEHLDRLRPDAPNWLAAQAFRLLTQAQVKRALGDRHGAATDLVRFEDRFAGQPAMVAEALALRVAVAVERGDLSTARSTVETLSDRFSEHRAYGEACLHLARALRGRARSDDRQDVDRRILRESIRLRRRARAILGAAFTARHEYVLAVDEMDLGRHDRALEILDVLDRGRPRALEAARDGLTLRRVRCLMQLDRLPEAERVIAALVARKPDYLAPLHLQAILLGGTAFVRDERVLERRYLDRPVPAFRAWERIKTHAERVTPYGAIWFEAQFHIALLNHWRGNTERVRTTLRWIEVSGYDPFDGHDCAGRFRWLAEQVGWDVAKKRVEDRAGGGEEDG